MNYPRRSARVLKLQYVTKSHKSHNDNNGIEMVTSFARKIICKPRRS